MLVYFAHIDKIEHVKFKFILNYISENDLLILNNTKVISAKILGKKETGGKVEILFIEEIEKNRFRGILKGKNPEGKKILVGDYVLRCYKDSEGYIFEIENSTCKDFLERKGLPPLPPYIKRMPEDIDRIYYQSVFAEKNGSIAAPTASLHFTKILLKRLKEKGVKIKYINLKIGRGTFTPIKVKDIRKHRMEEEYYEIPDDTIFEIKRVKEKGGRIFVCGTTCVRALESYALTGKREGFTDLFIYPPFEFKLTDALITNFHLPKSTPLLLVSAFLNKKKLFELYEIAKEKGYRFLSYGDAMLIIKRD